jgi:putative PIN family toxin of toxin-antitoxin system
MIRVVLDTTVIVSAVISPNGPNARLFDLILDKEIRPYVTAAVLDEYVKVFDYEHLKHLSKAKVARLRSVISRVGVVVKPAGKLKISGHEDDNRIYECAVAAKAHYIVTENKKHFTRDYKSTKIVNARQLIAIIEGAVSP